VDYFQGGWQNLANHDTCFYIYSAANSAADAILQDILDNTTGFTIGSCPSTEIEYDIDYGNLLSAIKLIADTLEFEWYVNDNKEVYIESAKGVTISATLTNFVGLVHKIESTYPRLITRFYGLGNYDGSDQVTTLSENTTATTDYGLREKFYTDRSQLDADVLKATLDVLLDGQDQPLDGAMGSIPEEDFFDLGLATGDTVTLFEPQFNLDGSYRIQSWTTMGARVLLVVAEVLPPDLIFKDVGDLIGSGKVETEKEITQKIQSD